mmetsp:Transcript_4518/g.16195  ORF Transcript_4518/g.16195 Transcript_4518/m.16195 type:complete len:335 (+) Transcript_4518:136-1140(+)
MASTTVGKTCVAASSLQFVAANKRARLSAAPLRASPARVGLSRKTGPVCVFTPENPSKVNKTSNLPSWAPESPTITRDRVRELEGLLDGGESLYALSRFNNALRALPDDVDEVDRRMRAVWLELCFNLESFNPIFTAVLLKVQCTIGLSDYEKRDDALHNLIVPLGGEYGLAQDKPLGKTHRVLFAEFYESCTGKPLTNLLGEGEHPVKAEWLFASMLRDVSNGGGAVEPMEQATYALGYNLAVEYLAAYEKGWMLDSFRALSDKTLAKNGRNVDWTFLEVHAEGEPEHADLGHNAVTCLVPAAHEDILRQAMLDHDRDFAIFYNYLADLLLDA